MVHAVKERDDCCFFSCFSKQKLRMPSQNVKTTVKTHRKLPK